MEFRELAWAQQLQRMKLQYGDAAVATERSLPNFPGESLRQVIEVSRHPHNLEPLLLTLARQQNAATRVSFAEHQGELVLIQKLLSKEPIAQDRQVAVMGTSTVVDAADGICYPSADSCISYEVWLRVEMLSILATMISEGLVKSLAPAMQAKLAVDLLALFADTQQHELLRLYAYRAAHQATKHFVAARQALLGEGRLLKAATAALTMALSSEHTASSPFQDPQQLLGVLSTAAESLYLGMLSGLMGDYTGKLPTSAPASGQVLAGLDRLPDMAGYVGAGLMPLLARAVEAAWNVLSERNAACRASEEVSMTLNAGSGQLDDTGTAGGGAAIQKALAAVADSKLSYADNWQLYMAVVSEESALPHLARVVIEFGCSLLQLMAAQLGGGTSLALPDVLLEAPPTSSHGPNWPAAETLQQMAECNEDLLIASSAQQMLGMVGKQQGQQQQQQQQQRQPMALMVREGHRALMEAVFPKRCCQCNVLQAGGALHKRCGQCHKTLYCSEGCQRAHWKAGHKMECRGAA